MLLMLMLGQALADLPAIEFDLGEANPQGRSCTAAGGEGIVVCAKRRMPDRAPTLPDIVDALPRAEVGLFGAAKGRIGVQQGSVGGFSSNRVMATVAIPF
jgi:hypothetical protein